MKDAIRSNRAAQARFRRHGELGAQLRQLSREVAGLAGVVAWALLPVCIAICPGLPGLR